MKLKIALAATALSLVMAPAMAGTVKHHGATMHHSGTIVQTAIGTKDLSTLVAAVKAAGLVDTLSGSGPFTVFAPTNAAFAKLPAGTVDTLLKPENKGTLTGVLTYHVVAGKVTSADLVKLIKAGGGSAVVTTVNGTKLTAKWHGKHIVLVDAKGGMSMVTAANVAASNGVVHVIDSVLMP